MSDKQDNREKMPNTAESIDLFRELFGSGLKLIYAEEGGHTIGKKPEENARWQSLHDIYIPPKPIEPTKDKSYAKRK